MKLLIHTQTNKTNKISQSLSQCHNLWQLSSPGRYRCHLQGWITCRLRRGRTCGRMIHTFLLHIIKLFSLITEVAIFQYLTITYQEAVTAQTRLVGTISKTSTRMRARDGYVDWGFSRFWKETKYMPAILGINTGSKSQDTARHVNLIFRGYNIRRFSYPERQGCYFLGDNE